MEISFEMAEQVTRPHVSQDQTVYGWHVAVIVIGVAITLPAFLIGAEIMGALGTEQGTYAILAGGGILTVIASICIYVAVSERLTTYQLLEASFGRMGSRMVSFLMSLTLLGWFGVTVSLFGQAMAKSVEAAFGVLLPVEFYIIIGTMVMTITTIYGFHAMDILSKFSVPLMMLVLIAGVYSVSSKFTWSEIWTAPANAPGNISSFGGAVSIVVGAFMVGVVILPDISRFINRKSQVLVASVGSYGSFSSLILIMAGLPGLMTGEKNLITVMFQTGLGVPALVMMIFASWTSNISNLYSCSLGLTQVMPQVGKTQITVGAGIIGGLVALSGIMDHLIDFLVLLGIFIPPVAGIYMAHFFFVGVNSKRAVSSAAIISWVVASLMAMATSSGLFILTYIPALDSLLVAVILYVIIAKAYAYSPRSQPSGGY